MWSNNQSQSGGFMNGGLASPGTQGTPGGSGSAGSKKRSENIVPVQIQEILNSTDEIFTVEGIDVGMVIIVGQVMSINSSATKTTLVVDDQSGEIEVVQWINEDSRQKEKEAWSEGSHVKVIGNVRSQGEQSKKHVMAFKIQGVPTEAEMHAHLLEIVHSHLKIKQLQCQQNEAIGGFSQTGGQAMGSVTAQSFGNTKHDLVYGCIRQSMDNAGLHKEQLFGQIKAKMSKNEMETSLEFLSAEGHIYSTVDEDHFKSTDGE